MPIAGYAIHQGDNLWLRGLVGDPDGSVLLQDEILGKAADAEMMGIALADRLLAAGADKILAKVYADQ